MLKVALRGLAERKLRAGLTAAAIVLGVALMAGTYVLTDTFTNSFDEIFRQANEGTDVVVVPKEVVRVHGERPPAMDAALLERVRRVEGVETAAGDIFSAGVTVFDSEGEQVGTPQAPSFGSSASPDPFSAVTYVDGRPPRIARELALDEFSAERAGIEVGETIVAGGEEPAGRYRVTGVTRLGDVSSFGGATVATFVLPEAQRLTGKRGQLDGVSAAAAEGVSPQELKRRLRAALPQGVEVRTGDEHARELSSSIGEDLSVIKTALLVFAGVALFVGAFTIFNTFSITVAQRTRELGMLRTLGASRRQVLASVLLEAGAIALAAAGAGVLAGLGMAELLGSLLRAVGLDLPNTGNVVRARTIVVSLAVGVGITLVAALLPALRATRVTPMAALREGAAPAPSRRRQAIETAAAVAVSAAGVAAISVGLFADAGSTGNAALLLGAGAALVFLGVALLSPRLVRPLASLAGRPLELLRGLTGRLARESSLRNPGRTAVTAAALMVGLALVTFVTVFAAGIRKSIDEAIDRSFQGDLTLQNTDGFSPLPGGIGRAVAEVEGVRAASGFAFSRAKVRETGRDSWVSAVDPETVEPLIEIEWERGSDATLRELGRRGAIVDESFASDRGIEVGDVLHVLTPAGRRAAYTVRGSLKDAADLFGDFVVSKRALAADFAERRDALVLVGLDPRAGPRAARARLQRLVSERFPVAELLDQQELKDKQASQVNQLLGLLYALLSLAVVVSLFGIANALTLSIYERTRELGLLRALGMSRRQVRTMVRYESVIVALIGAALGLVLGVFFALIVSRPLAAQGFVLSIPVLSLAALAPVAVLAGVLAAILPARRASRLDILRALAYE